MRDAFGGLANIVVIVVFLVIVSGYLAFNVNYTKAFRVKNKIISTFEQYEGNCIDDTIAEGTCNGEIKKYMDAVGYNAPNFTITEPGVTWTCHYGYCFRKVPVTYNGHGANDDMKERAYFKIVTQINIDIPIINKIMPGLRIFQVTGDTKPIVIGW